MAKIAYARTFNGTSDEIQFSLGGLSGAWSAATIAAIAKPVTGISGDVPVLGIQGTLNLSLSSTQQDFYDYSTFNSWSSYPLADGVDDWYLIAYTKASGSQNPRLHQYAYTAGAWVHGDYLSAQANLASPSTPIRIGNNQFSQFFKGLVACVGVWKSTALSDAQIESLAFSLAPWQSLRPTSLWLLNQASTGVAVADRVSSSHQSSISGTTATSISDLPFDVSDDYASVVLEDSPLVFWPLQDRSGTTVADASGNGHTGSYTGTYTLGAASVLPAHPTLASMSVDLGYADSAYNVFNSNTPLTIEGWANRTDDTRHFSLFGGGDGAGADPLLRVDSGGNTVGWWSNTNDPERTWNAGPAVAAGKNFYYALRWSGATKQAELFINGVSLGTVTSTNDIAGAKAFVVGTWGDGAGDGVGRHAMAAVYSGSLSDARIRAHYEAGVEKGAESGRRIQALTWLS